MLRIGLIRSAQISKPLRLDWPEPSDDVSKGPRKVAKRFRNVENRPNQIGLDLYTNPIRLTRSFWRGCEKVAKGFEKDAGDSESTQLDSMGRTSRPNQISQNLLKRSRKGCEWFREGCESVRINLIRMGQISTPIQLVRSKPSDQIAKRLRNGCEGFRINLIRSDSASKPKIDRSGHSEEVVRSFRNVAQRFRKVAIRSNYTGLDL